MGAVVSVTAEDPSADLRSEQEVPVINVFSSAAKKETNEIRVVNNVGSL